MGDWRKSSFSGAAGQCVEVGSWRKSSRSGGSGACVEVGSGEAVIGVRGTQLAPSSPVLVVSASEWSRFLGALKLS